MSILWCSQFGVGRIMNFPSPNFIYNHYTFLLVLMVLLSGFPNTMGAPVDSETNEAWWLQPCTGAVQLRHARSGKSPVDIQFGYLADRMQNTIMPELEALYTKKPQSQMGNTCPKVNVVLNLIRKSANASKMRKANYIFYESIVKLGKFVNTMKNIPVKTKGKFNHTKRFDIYVKIEVNLRSVLCAFNESLGQKSRPRIPLKRIRTLLSPKCLPKSMDLTKAQIFDYDVIRKLKKFFHQGRKILVPKINKREHNRKNRTKRRKNAALKDQ